jgi:hypothetical protein
MIGGYLSAGYEPHIMNPGNCRTVISVTFVNTLRPAVAVSLANIGGYSAIDLIAQVNNIDSKVCF